MARNPFTRKLQRPRKPSAAAGRPGAVRPDWSPGSYPGTPETAGNDLETLGIPELKSLEARISRRIETLRSENEAETLETILKVAEQAGMTRQDLILKLGGYLIKLDAFSARSPKYRHPETGETWGGIGRKPNWVKRFEAAGGRLEDLAQATHRAPQKDGAAAASGGRT